MTFDFRVQSFVRWVTPDEALPLHKEIVRIECTTEPIKRGFYNVRLGHWFALNAKPIQVKAWYKIEPTYGYEHLVTTVFFTKHRKSPNDLDDDTTRRID